MDLLKHFLKRFEKLKDPKEDKRDIAQILSKFLGVEIKTEDIQFHHTVVTISHATGIIRTILFQHKEAIIRALKEEHPKLLVTDFKFS